jgi:hypothetical protein
MKPDGGPAFPLPAPTSSPGTWGGGPAPHPGMTLRDYFAALAMQSLIGASENAWLKDAPSTLAERSYAFADAMLSARENA